MTEYSVQEAINQLIANKDTITIDELGALIDGISVKKNVNNEIVDFPDDLTTCL